MENKITFISLIENQFKYGGKKYANDSQKEATDILCEDFGTNGLLWTIAKYVLRYKNLGQEKELLKIGCYMYILWLKRGFHLNQQGTPKIINTTVETKEKFFPLFLKRVDDFNEIAIGGEPDPTLSMNDVYTILKEIASKPFNEVGGFWLYTIWNTVKLEWEKKFANVKVHNTDAK